MPCNPSVHGKRDLLDGMSVAPPNAFSIAVGNPSNLGYFLPAISLKIEAAISQRKDEQYPETTDRLVESIGAQTPEPRLARVKDVLHLHVETLSPPQFLEGVRTFLDRIGIDEFVEISVNEERVQVQQSDKPGLQEALAQCREILREKGPRVQTIEISSNGKNDRFSLLLRFHYSRKHLHDVAPVELEVRAMSNELGPRLGESFPDYKARMKVIDADVERRQKVYESIAGERKALYSDFAHHLAEAFPEVRLRLYEATILGDG